MYNVVTKCGVDVTGKATAGAKWDAYKEGRSHVMYEFCIKRRDKGKRLLLTCLLH